ncbi:MAG: outer membrane protein transport protein, partial [Paracoccaceae bacterium]
FTTTALSFKTAINDRFDLALVLDQPIGADVDYKAGTGYLYGGSTASLDSSAVTVMGRYKLNGGFSVFGGLRAQSVEGKVALFSGYSLDTSRETDFGYLVGMAYEKPEIALRVALTYNSSITHDFAASEADPLNGPASTSFKTEVPQSLNLEFQTGIAKDTLLFGSVRWVDWTAFDISPVNYVGLYTDPLVSYHDDTITYNVGVGRRFNDTWSAAITLGYEPSVGGFAGNLGPTDGFTSIGLAGTYTRGRMKITGGVRYAMIGDAKTKTPAVLPYPPGTTFGKFKDNHALGFGLKVGYSF